MRTARTNCLACIFRLPLLLGSFSGWSPLSIQCPHTNHPRVHFEVSFACRFLSSLLLACSVVYLPMAVLNVLWSMNITPRLILVVYEAIAVSASVLTGACGVVKAEQKAAEMNGLAAVLENANFYGVESFVEDRQTRRATLGVKTAMMTFFFGWLNVVVFAYLQENHTEFDSPTIRTYSIGFSCCLQSAVFVQFLLSNYVYEILFTKCFETLKKALTKKCFQKAAQLRKLQRLHEALVCNYRQLNSFYNPAFLICWMAVIITLTLSFTLELVYKRDGVANVTIASRNAIGIVLMLLYIISSDRISVVTENVLSFLFKYPISKLSIEEAAQVELFIKTLIVHKPTITASDVFAVRKGLVAPICGTIVTYVLVALQFHSLAHSSESNFTFLNSNTSKCF